MTRNRKFEIFTEWLWKMEQLKKELSYECGYGLSDTLFSLILDASTEIHLKKRSRAL